MEFDREGLQEFVASGDKSPPPVFVGRKEILQDIEATSRRSWKGSEALVHGNPGETRVVQGAPGAGKSSIIVELTNRLQEKNRDFEGTPSAPVPRVVNISPEMVVENLPSVLSILAGAAGLSTSAWWNLNTKISAGATIGVAHLEGEVGKPSRNQKKPESISELAEIHPPNKWQAPVIVAIDEAQRFDGGRFTAHARFLQSIHDSKLGLPLMLVLAGLGDTAERASDMSLTRGKKVHEIGSLDPEEVGGFMLSCCRRFGMNPLGHEERIMELAAPCEGWPRHLHFALQTLGREALKSGGDLSGVAWKKIRQEAAQSRTRYYQGQQSPTMKIASALVGKVLVEFQNKSKITDVINAIINHAGSNNGVEWQLPVDMTPQSLVYHLVHQGALLENVDNTISLGIPSFRSYLIETGGFTLAPPTDDMIRQARNHCRMHGKSLSEWREQGSFLDKELQAAEQYIKRKRDELDKTGILSFQRKRQLQEDLAKGEVQLGEIRERQRSRLPPPLPPSPTTLGIARCMTISEVKKVAALEKVKELEKKQIFLPAKPPVSAGYVTEVAPAETLLFVVGNQAHVMPSGSHGRKWHHFAIWAGKDVEQLQTLKVAFPETRIVVEPGLRSIWPGNIPAVESEEANRLMHETGLSSHLQDVDLARDDPGNVNAPASDNQMAVGREKDPETGLGTPKMGM